MPNLTEVQRAATAIEKVSVEFDKAGQCIGGGHKKHKPKVYQGVYCLEMPG